MDEIRTFDDSSILILDAFSSKFVRTLVTGQVGY